MKEGNASGAKGPWVKAVRSRTGVGTQSPVNASGDGPDETCSKPAADGVCAPSLNPSGVLGKATRGYAFASNRTGEIPPSGMIVGDTGNGSRHGMRHRRVPTRGRQQRLPVRRPIPRLCPTRLLGSERARAGNRPGYSPMTPDLGASPRDSPRPGVTTHQVPETESVQVREIPIPDSQLA